MGFVTEIDADTVPPGLNEDVIRLISKKKDEPEVHAGVAPKVPALAHMQEPTWPTFTIRHRLPGHLLLRSSQDQRQPAKKPRRRRSGTAPHV